MDKEKLISCIERATSLREAVNLTLNELDFAWAEDLFKINLLEAQQSEIVARNKTLQGIIDAQAHRLELAEEMAAEWSRAPTPDRMATAIEAPMKSFILSGQRQIVARTEAPIPNPVKPISGPSHLDGMEITTT
jgi:hypothetical protein